MFKKVWVFLGLAVVVGLAVAAASIGDPNARLWIWTFLGRFHPLVVHFPIALLICATLAELIGRLAPRAIPSMLGGATPAPSGSARRGPGDVVLFCLLLGWAGACLAGALGWLNATSQDFSGRSLELLDWHRYAGTATVVLSTCTAAFALSLRRQHRPALDRLFLAGLLSCALCVSISGYFGGSLVFGDDYLTSALPHERHEAIDVADLPETSGRIDFVADIQPLFETTCYECHGPDKQKGRLRLDARHLAVGGGRSGRAIVPGNADESELLSRVLGEGSERRMPLEEDPLPVEQIASLRAWIAQGAPWPDAATVADAILEPHWAYTVPDRPEPPVLEGSAWIRNPIDAFVLARLTQEGLSPSPEADRETLIRRLSFDLIGLPPSVEEVDAFLGDTSPGAYDRVVDRLLASPHYGEKWASHWLDLARYADSEGHDFDNKREIWKYRDWVISALNDDLPFDRFTIEQIAGDLLPDATVSNRIATGFHRNTMFNREAGVDQEEAHWEVLVDRVGTTGSVWLGSTLACAQCHDHKYDPFSQVDFYRFLAFFNNAELTLKTLRPPNIPAIHFLEEPIEELPSPTQADRHQKLRAKLAELERQLEVPTPRFEAERRAWEASVLAAESQWLPLDPDDLSSTGGSTLDELPDHSVLVTGTNPGSDTYRLSGLAPVAEIAAVRLEVLTHPSLPGDGPGRFHDGGFVLTGFEGAFGPATDATDATDASEALSFHAARADGTRPFHDVEHLLAASEPGLALSANGWSARPGESHRVVLTTDRRVVPRAGTRLTFQLHHGRHVIGRLGIGRFRILVTGAQDPFATIDVHDDVLSAVLLPREERTPEQEQAIVAYFRTVAPHLRPLRERIAALEQRLEELEVISTLVLKDKPTTEPLTARVREGGSFASPGERVAAGAPDFLHALPAGQPTDRLALAHWLVDDENPLVARVTVNRYWEQIFGRGIVETTEDFGSQGAEPSHPDLLDWLATEFVRRGWSVKQIHRRMLTSATYRQSSGVTPELQERDPQNRLLARAPRSRLSAEHIRDAALASSGLLSRWIGGPPVFPFRPKRAEPSNFAANHWRNSRGVNRYRRSVYTFWRRTNLHPLLAILDAPSREASTGRRTRTNTPVQALAVLNEHDGIDAARGLASQLVQLGAADDRARATHGFRTVLTRSPEASELDRIMSYYRGELEHFQNQPDAAAALLRDDEHLRDSNGLETAGADAPRLAAWTMLSSALLNLDEAVSKQ